MRARIGTTALVLGGTLAIAGTAVGIAPVRGGRYSGRVSQAGATLTVSFRVSRSGTKITGLNVKPALPNRCGYGGPTLPTHTSQATGITKGAFTATIKEKTGGTVTATATVTGTFLAHGAEHGTIKTTVPSNRSCSGSFRYSTKAAAGQ